MLSGLYTYYTLPLVDAARANSAKTRRGGKVSRKKLFEGESPLRANPRRGYLFSAGASRALARVESARDGHIRSANKMLAHLSLR